MTDLRELAEEERGELLALTEGLTAEQWESPSLCDGWTVRDVVVHVVSFDELSWSGLVTTFLRGGLAPNRVNGVALGRYAEAGPAEVVELLRRTQRPRGLTAAMGGGIALTDGTIHQQDVRRPLGLPRVIPERRLVPVLDFSLGAPTLPSRRNARGLRLVAADVDWSYGDGPEVTGPGEALLMAAAGREDALADLVGEGVETLRSRVRPH